MKKYLLNIAAVTSLIISFSVSLIGQITVPVLSTTSATSIASNSAISGGLITTDGGGSIIARGICWALTINPNITDSKTSDGTGIGSFSSSITGLLPNTTYHVRAYATNCIGTAYGNDITFTTFDGSPAATISGPTEVCIDEVQPDITFTAVTGTAPITFTYKINGGNNQTVIATSGNSVKVPVPTATAGQFRYSIVSIQDANSTAVVTGSVIITVKPRNTILLTSANNTQTLKVNTPITKITYSTTGATEAVFTGLPAGVTGKFECGIISVSGTPVNSGNFDYTVTANGGCGMAKAAGTIIVTPEFIQGVPGQTIFESITLTQDIEPGPGPGLIIAGNNVVVEGEGYKILGNGTGDGVVIDNSSEVKISTLFISGFEKSIDVKGGSSINISENYLFNNNIGLYIDQGNAGTFITNNIIANNTTGIQLESSGHKIYRNLLLNNERQIIDIAVENTKNDPKSITGGNTWYDPKEQLGNYWSNYWGKDDGSNGRIAGDFIGDTRLPHENIDNYPLLDPTIPAKFGDLLWTLHEPASDPTAFELPLLDPLKIASGPLIGLPPIAPEPLPPVCLRRWCCRCGGWSPIEIQAVDPLGRIVSSDLNQNETNAFYTENEVIIPGDKLVQILICPSLNDLNDGKYTYLVHGLKNGHYSMDWFTSYNGKRVFHTSEENIPILEGETREVITDINVELDQTGCPLEINAVRLVEIDIIPGSDKNPINSTAKGVIPVAIIGRADFEVKTVDPGTITLEALALNIPKLAINIPAGSNKLQANYTDINKDGYVDLVVQIYGGKREFKVGTAVATIKGNLKSEYGGWKIAGQNIITVVPQPGSKAISSSIQDESYTQETQFELFQNYPNPFTNITTIWFVLPEDSKVVIEVFDNIIGKKVATLINKNLSSGPHKVEFESKNIETGTYTYRITAGKYQQAKNMIHIRE